MEQTRAETISTEIEERIFDGTYSDGDRLDEVSLAAQFGVSRTPLREALQRLARSGLVEIVPRRGAFVRQPGFLELIELFEVMAEFEALCGRLAAKRISDTALSELRDANARCQTVLVAKSPDAYFTANERFHKIIYEESGNGFLANETAALQRRLRPFRRQQLRLRGRMAQSMNEHDAIVEGLENGKSETVANTLRKHVAIQGEKFHHLMTNMKNAEQVSDKKKRRPT